MELSALERLKNTPITYNTVKGGSTFLWLLVGQHGQLVPIMSQMHKYSQYQQLSNRSCTGANRNLLSFSVGSVWVRSVFSVDSTEFGSVTAFLSFSLSLHNAIRPRRHSRHVAL